MSRSKFCQSCFSSFFEAWLDYPGDGLWHYKCPNCGATYRRVKTFPISGDRPKNSDDSDNQLSLF